MFEIENTNDGGFFWRLKSPDFKETLCHSETYTTKRAAEAGIAACKRIAPDAKINDLTGKS